MTTFQKIQAFKIRILPIKKKSLRATDLIFYHPECVFIRFLLDEYENVMFCVHWEKSAF